MPTCTREVFVISEIPRVKEDIPVRSSVYLSFGLCVTVDGRYLGWGPQSRLQESKVEFLDAVSLKGRLKWFIFSRWNLVRLLENLWFRLLSLNFNICCRSTFKVDFGVVCVWVLVTSRSLNDWSWTGEVSGPLSRDSPTDWTGPVSCRPCWSTRGLSTHDDRSESS